MDFLQFLFSKKFFKHLLIATGITVVLVLLTLKSLSWYTKHEEYIIVPDFRGIYLQEVVGNPDNRDYQFSVVDSIFDPNTPLGTVLTQDPFPGSKVKRNRNVYLTTTSFVPEKTQMPDLHDLTLRQAQSILESAGLRLGKLFYIRSFDEDAVQNQLFEGRPIKAGTMIDKGSVINLTVGMGARATEMKQSESLETDSVE